MLVLLSCLTNHCLIRGHEDLHLCLVLALTFKSLIYFMLIFYVWFEVGIQFHSSTCDNPVVPSPLAENTILFSLNALGTLVKSQLNVSISLFLDSEFFSIDLCVWPYASTTLSWLLQLCSKVWKWEMWVLQLVFFFPQECLGILDLLHFHVNFRISLFISAE